MRLPGLQHSVGCSHGCLVPWLLPYLHGESGLGHQAWSLRHHGHILWVWGVLVHSSIRVHLGLLIGLIHLSELLLIHGRHHRYGHLLLLLGLLTRLLRQVATPLLHVGRVWTWLPRGLLVHALLTRRVSVLSEWIRIRGSRLRERASWIVPLSWFSKFYACGFCWFKDACHVSEDYGRARRSITTGSWGESQFASYDGAVFHVSHLGLNPCESHAKFLDHAVSSVDLLARSVRITSAMATRKFWKRDSD